MSRRRTPAVDRSPYLNHRSAVEPIDAPDGSTVRELLHPTHHAIERMSIAEAEVAPGQRTRLHRHPLAEEVYHILDGAGVLQLGEERIAVVPGDIIRIAPQQAHRIEAKSETPLRFLCICQPAYRDEDTEFLDADDTSP
ncbi:cupin domain-containing protein [Guyparkeria hydrothermalis]|uniref:cupin domain-containing protein n=1 Tax=Guyparkeria hydrothermalis TaxID=923 RepID=UPI002020A00D|nr:cupin domain-containing protein [Guyparkeria hydrothermalis]MCL7744222.1 cupin domain-containing protein [Guyparkeria hydrothermalis]